MADIIDELNRIEKLISALKYIKFEFGIFDEDGNQIEEISVYNLDGTVTKEKMSLADIMYLTDKGSITIPAKPILYHIYRQMEYDMPRMLEELHEGIMEKKWGLKEIREHFQQFNRKINLVFIPNAVLIVLSSDNVISGLLDREEETKYTYDLKKLKKFIKSKVFLPFN